MINHAATWDKLCAIIDERADRAGAGADIKEIAAEAAMDLGICDLDQHDVDEICKAAREQMAAEFADG